MVATNSERQAMQADEGADGRSVTAGGSRAAAPSLSFPTAAILIFFPSLFSPFAQKDRQIGTRRLPEV